MSAVATAPLRLPAIVGELFERQRVLTSYGLLLLALTLPALGLQHADPRLLEGVNIWVKPAKFLVSIAVFALTAAWFFGYVRPERRTSLLMRGTMAVLIASSAFEIVYITLQAGQGLASHFNHSTPYFALMYNLMGVAAVLLVGTTLPMAWEIGRRPERGLSGDYVAAVVLGLVLCFLLGGGLGGYMASMPGHAVGATGGHVPLVGWNRGGGDLRIAHFFGIHAQQAIPLLGALIGGYAARMRWALLIGGTGAYVAMMLALFMQAIAGRALLPL